VIAGIIEHNRDGIAALGRKHRVQALWVFGSAVTGGWDPETSDIDVLVDLGGYEAGVVDRYLDLADELEALLGCRVDLVSVGGLRHHPRMRDELDRTKVMLYERARTPSVA
jgi:predicted nucleotidyltransferase